MYNRFHQSCSSTTDSIHHEVPLSITLPGKGIEEHQYGRQQSELDVNESIFIERLAQSLSLNGGWSVAANLLCFLREHGPSVCIFGGALRDLAWACKFPEAPAPTPRDFDIVVDGISIEALDELLKKWVVRHNRFGGYRLLYMGTYFDVWRLEDTWAVRQGFAPQRSGETTFAALPYTTFLNTEAIAVELLDLNTNKLRLYENGFFAALNNRSIDIVLEANSRPDQCVVRTCMTIQSLMETELHYTKYVRSFKLEAHLASFLRKQVSYNSKRHFYRLLTELYGQNSNNKAVFRQWVDIVGQGICRSVSMPKLSPRQDRSHMIKPEN